MWDTKKRLSVWNTHTPTRITIGIGWSDFSKSNSEKVKDQCVFGFVLGRGNISKEMFCLGHENRRSCHPKDWIQCEYCISLGLALGGGIILQPCPWTPKMKQRQRGTKKKRKKEKKKTNMYQLKVLGGLVNTLKN